MRAVWAVRITSTDWGIMMAGRLTTTATVLPRMSSQPLLAVVVVVVVTVLVVVVVVAVLLRLLLTLDYNPRCPRRHCGRRRTTLVTASRVSTPCQWRSRVEDAIADTTMEAVVVPVTSWTSATWTRRKQCQWQRLPVCTCPSRPAGAVPLAAVPVRWIDLHHADCLT